MQNLIIVELPNEKNHNKYFLFKNYLGAGSGSDERDLLCRNTEDEQQSATDKWQLIVFGIFVLVWTGITIYGE